MSEADHTDLGYDFDLEFLDVPVVRREFTRPASPIRRREFARCRYCGGGPFQWVHLPDGWRLKRPSGTLHVCKAHPASKIGGAP